MKRILVALLLGVAVTSAVAKKPKPVAIDGVVEVRGELATLPVPPPTDYARMNVLATGSVLGSGVTVEAFPPFDAVSVVKTVDLQLPQISVDYCTVQLIGAPLGHAPGVILERRFRDDSPGPEIFSAVGKTVSLNPGITFGAGSVLQVRLEASQGIFPPNECELNALIVCEKP